MVKDVDHIFVSQPCKFDTDLIKHTLIFFSISEKNELYIQDSKFYLEL